MPVYRFPIPSLLAAANPANGLRTDLNRVLGEMFAADTDRAAAPVASLVADAREDASGFTIELDVPGVAPEAVEVLAEDGVLTIRGERAPRELAADEKLVMNERALGAFVRRFRLPKSADASAISASCAHGVLTVRIAKLAPSQPRRVTVNVGA